jgi:hypothetical protein
VHPNPDFQQRYAFTVISQPRHELLVDIAGEDARKFVPSALA